jgi:GTP cyclohydrolase I
MDETADIFGTLETRLRKKYYGWAGSKQFEGTAGRISRALDEFCWTNDRINKELDKHFSAVFEDRYDEMLVVGPVSVWTLCPHHLLPCKFEVHIGYIPNELVLGLSKLARIAYTLAKRPVIQEMYTREVADVIQQRLKPQGVGVYVHGYHDCMRSRGVQQEAGATTSALTGAMLYNPGSRAEFFSIVRGGNNR